MEKLIIYGNGDVARMIGAYLKHHYDICCFTVDEAVITSKKLSGTNVIPFSRIQQYHPPASHKIIIAIGYADMNDMRKSRYETAKEMGYSFINYIHETARIHETATVGENNIILENTVAHPFSTIGNSNNIGSNVNIGHDCNINNNCWINGGVSIAGNTTIHDNCFLGVNSSVRDNIVIREKTLIGAGTHVAKSTPPNSIHINQTRYLPTTLSSSDFLSVISNLDDK